MKRPARLVTRNVSYLGGVGNISRERAVSMSFVEAPQAFCYDVMLTEMLGKLMVTTSPPRATPFRGVPWIRQVVTQVVGAYRSTSPHPCNTLSLKAAYRLCSFSLSAPFHGGVGGWEIKKFARAALTPVRACAAVNSCFRGRGRDGSLCRLTFPPPPTRPYCRSRGLEARGLLRITALTQRGCKRTYTSSRNDLTTQGYPIEGDAVDLASSYTGSRCISEHFTLHPCNTLS